MAKRILLTIVIIVGLILLLLVGLIGFLSITEYKPEPVEDASLSFTNDNSEAAKVDEEFTLYSWNIGYGGLGEESDFFMDGGAMVNPPSQETVEKNLDGITNFIDEKDADAWLIQEADLNSDHTENVNEVSLLQKYAGENGAFAYNYNCKFVPIPLPPMGRI
ncbi:MAG: endonuclease, partial [Firmicutes bacterium]|nr:endonuclease [Bacillota bacterium]